MFLYCFTKEDKKELNNKGFQFIKQENIGDKIAYIFLYNNKLNFELDGKKFITTDKMTF